MSTTTQERCPTCGKPGLPPLKTCALDTCRKEFRVPEGGVRSDAGYCSRRHAKAAAQRAFRQRKKERAS